MLVSQGPYVDMVKGCLGTMYQQNFKYALSRAKGKVLTWYVIHNLLATFSISGQNESMVKNNVPLRAEDQKFVATNKFEFYLHKVGPIFFQYSWVGVY